MDFALFVLNGVRRYFRDFRDRFSSVARNRCKGQTNKAPTEFLRRPTRIMRFNDRCDFDREMKKAIKYTSTSQIDRDIDYEKKFAPILHLES